MDFLDVFSSEEKKVERHTRRVTDRDAQAEDREASARWLAERGTSQALMGLMARFDLNLEHQLKDKTEKELVFALILERGEAAKTPLRAWLKHGKQFAFPLRLVAEMEGRAEAINVAFEMLKVEAEKDDFKPAKKTDILVWLAEVHDERVFQQVPHFLKDFDEGVRYSAAEVLITQKDDRAREPLLDLILNPKEESNRLKSRIAEVFSSRGWAAPEALAELLPPAFALRGGRIYPSR